MKLELLKPCCEKYCVRENGETLTLELDESVAWSNPITDRNQKDIDRLSELLNKGWKNFDEAEKKEWLETDLKGALNYSDLIRIQNNIQFLSDVLELNLMIGSVPELPDKAFYENILLNVGCVRKAYSIHSTTPQTPEEPLNLWQKWNDLEQILKDVHEILLNNFSYYCGNEIYAGENSGLLL